METIAISACRDKIKQYKINNKKNVSKINELNIGNKKKMESNMLKPQ